MNLAKWRAGGASCDWRRGEQSLKRAQVVGVMEQPLKRAQVVGDRKGAAFEENRKDWRWELKEAQPSKRNQKIGE
jgi:hypothetical protein